MKALRGSRALACGVLLAAVAAPAAANPASVALRAKAAAAVYNLDHDVAVALQRGLPDSTSALVTVTAVERNWVNWARGGTFNPSGQVRVPSVRGDGTGVFGSALIRAFRVVSQSQPSALPPCPPDIRAPAGG